MIEINSTRMALGLTYHMVKHVSLFSNTKNPPLILKSSNQDEQMFDFRSSHTVEKIEEFHKTYMCVHDFNEKGVGMTTKYS